MKILLFTVLAMALAVAVFGRGKDSRASKATFAGGCFWCVEAAFEELDGVISATSGYTGGDDPNPTYEQVSTGMTGHVEAVQVVFDASRISYEEILDVFWRQIDPTDDGGQFADRGSQYRTAIFYHDDEQKRLAEASRKRIESSMKFKRPLVTRILKAGPFYEAEAYHQSFFKTNPDRYYSYKNASGRTSFLKSTWNEAKKETKDKKKPSDAELKKTLSSLQYRVTQESGTEPPFRNEYWNNHDEGIYLDVVTKEPLFSSLDKFDSGTGWPSFSKPLDPAEVIEVADTSHGMTRVEVRSKSGDTHLGHVFDDGPKPEGKRYCINSASLEFVPKEMLDSRGLREYKSLFEKKAR